MDKTFVSQNIDLHFMKSKHQPFRFMVKYSIVMLPMEINGSWRQSVIQPFLWQILMVYGMEFDDSFNPHLAVWLASPLWLLPTFLCDMLSG